MTSGRSRLVALLGQPVAQSLSPVLQNAAFAACDLDLVYLAFDVATAALPAALDGLRALGAAGANVTRPHKEQAARLCDALSADAALCGAVNTITFEEGQLTGDNTDVAGFARALVEAGIETAGRTAVVVGAGGAARAVAVALARGGADRVIVAARREEAARALARALEELRVVEPRSLAAPDALADAALLIDATPGADLELLERLPPSAAVVALAYGPSVPLVVAARAAGRRAEDGLGMLLHQGALAFERFTGRTAPLAIMRQAIGLRTCGAT